MNTAAVQACKQHKNDQEIHPNGVEFLHSLDQRWHTYTNRGWQVNQSVGIDQPNYKFSLEILIH